MKQLRGDVEIDEAAVDG